MGTILLLKVKKLVKPVIGIGREFQILGPWWSIVIFLRLVRRLCGR